jgi:hypothetical protein
LSTFFIFGPWDYYLVVVKYNKYIWRIGRVVKAKGVSIGCSQVEMWTQYPRNNGNKYPTDVDRMQGIEISQPDRSDLAVV